jgi:hypothetical protein
MKFMFGLLSTLFGRWLDSLLGSWKYGYLLSFQGKE